MKQAEELYDEHLTRIKKAVALQKPDRTPVIISNLTFAPRHMGVKMSNYVKDIELMNKILLQSFLDLKDGDGVQVTAVNPLILSTIWFSKIKLPGVELNENEVWQVSEHELIKVEDYDVILSKGWKNFTADFFLNRLDDLHSKLAPYIQFISQAEKNFIDAGIVNINNGIPFNQPFEMLCGGRTMTKFFKDLYTIPDKVQATMDVIMDESLPSARQTTAAIKPFGAWIGGWRSASEFLRPSLWERFVWPYLKRLGDAMIEEGGIPIFHLDSNWVRDLDYFKVFPKGKCIISLDGSTNIYKAKEILGDRMCIMGDVPAGMLSIGTSEEVYNYSKKLINDIGPEGFILSSGCDIPANAKVENVKAMISAVTGE